MSEARYLVGISSFSFPFACGSHPEQRPDRPLSPAELIEKARELGAQCVQFGDNMPLEDYSDEYLSELGRKAKAYDIVLEMGMREIKTERLLRYIEIAELTGAGLIRCITDGRGGNYEPDEDEICGNIEKVLPILIEKDIILGVENHDRILADEYAAIAARINDPHVGLVVDTTNSLSTEEPTSYVLEKMAPYCVCLHLKDYQIHRANSGFGLLISGACPGCGRQNIPLVIETAKKLAGRDFNIILESWMEPCETLEASLKQEEEWARRGLEYIKEIIMK